MDSRQERLGTFVTILGAVSMKQIKRLDDLEKNSASKKERESLDECIGDEMAEARQERRDRDERLDKRLDKGFRSIHERSTNSMRPEVAASE
jgi:predicted secreted protein